MASTSLTALAALDGLDDGDLRFEAWSGRAVNMAEVLLATLRKKGGRYGSVPRHYSKRTENGAY